MAFEIKVDDLSYKAWYKNRYVLGALTYQMRYREGAVLGEINIRNMKIRDVSHLNENINRFDLLTKYKVNWYYSLAVLSTMPIFSFNLEERKKQGKAFENVFTDFMRGYDWALDFDAKNIPVEVALDNMRKVHNWMKEENIAHSVRCSGSGFHIVVYSNYMWQSPFIFKKDYSSLLCSIMGCALKKKFDLKSLDDSIYDNRRIFKVPFSLDIKTGNICRPLNEYEITNFSYDMVKPEYCVGDKEIFFNRGLFLGSAKGVHKFIFSIFPECKTSMQIWDFLKKCVEESNKVKGGK